MSQQQQVVLGYWPIRGKAQFLRYLLEYTQIPYEDKIYTDPKQWFEQDKKNLGIEFPNLPYLIDGDFKLTESAAIGKYIANKSQQADQLLGNNNLNKFGQINMLYSVIHDLQAQINKLCYQFDEKTFEAQKEQFYKDNIEKFVQNLSSYLANKKFLLGEELTLPDFVFFEMIDQLNYMLPEQIKEFENLKNYIKNFREVESLKKFFGENENKVFNSPMYAAWAGPNFDKEAFLKAHKQ
ncbi:Thioredoxin-like fold [Pseudocohnilembus persalinus]|uniref:glutathione transferase n=1 Tax=Pseudocohnilembus persalinus TaxID=266149 RepID=A0A0V0QQ70_PSEPJ|nr:Thioredoxin-like fold [Pseudocohnilembus persalinus]|eukprot:KRX04409.1 Thioredoxin-like fold [Pseudocohnilembus persalinus]